MKEQVFLSSVRCEPQFSLTLKLKSTYIKNDKNNKLKSSVAIKDNSDKLDFGAGTKRERVLFECG